MLIPDPGLTQLRLHESSTMKRNAVPAIAATILAIVPVFLSTIPGLTAETALPNVVLVLIDDMGHGDIAAHGNPVIKTPNFDRLCHESVRFTNFAVSPTCSPTRAALITGRHEFLVNVTGTVRGANELDLEATTIAQLFQAKGYLCICRLSALRCWQWF
jgi:hypothetical protein